MINKEKYYREEKHGRGAGTREAKEAELIDSWESELYGKLVVGTACVKVLR